MSAAQPDSITGMNSGSLVALLLGAMFAASATSSPRLLAACGSVAASRRKKVRRAAADRAACDQVSPPAGRFPLGEAGKLCPSRGRGPGRAKPCLQSADHA